MNVLFERLISEYGEEITQRIIAGYSVNKPVTLRINTLKTKVDEVYFALKNLHVEYCPVAWFDDALILKGISETELLNTTIYREGKIYLQSLSSMLPPLYLQPQSGESILDMTAAPGGKTCEIAALSKGKALITACERDKIRFERLKFNLQRQGASRVSALCTDASTLDDFFSFDKILLDAPCTGTGTMTPANPIRFSDEYVKRCVKMQEKLLRKALKLLKKGGTLVYSTCSVLKEENENLLEHILPETHASIVPIKPFQGVPVLSSKEGTLAVLPNKFYEGFFVAKITK